MNNAILTVEGLKTYFPVRRGLWGTKRYVRAVDGVNLRIARGRTLGLVGESGSGKTTVGRTILRLLPPHEGRVVFDGHDVFSLGEREMRSLRRRMQIIFQDPYGSLDPRMTIESIIDEPLRVHTSDGKAGRHRRIGELLERVGLSPAYARRYPHEFSGGQRQRIGIARALATEPDFIICDEPVSALDVSIQAQILNLLNDLQDELGLTYLFIAHNLAVVEHFADDVAVMYLGRLVEVADRDTLYAGPVHPYTRSLLGAVPKPDPALRGTHVRLTGEVPSPIAPPPGCPFHPRCPYTREQAQTLPGSETVEVQSDGETIRVCAPCVQIEPSLQAVDGNPEHQHACTLKQVEAGVVGKAG